MLNLYFQIIEQVGKKKILKSFCHMCNIPKKLIIFFLNHQNPYIECFKINHDKKKMYIKHQSKTIVINVENHMDNMKSSWTLPFVTGSIWKCLNHKLINTKFSEFFKILHIIHISGPNPIWTLWSNHSLTITIRL